MTSDPHPSKSAQDVALYRAAHQVLDHPKVFVDPYATRILGRATEAALEETPALFSANPAIRASIVLRARYTEDQLAAAMKEGVQQYVILGAGLDTFAYRPMQEKLRIFEVDHPDMQEWKRNRLKEVDIDIPRSVAYVPMNFVTQKLDKELAKTDFDPKQPAVFSMLGLVIFLERTITNRILQFISTMPPKSRVVMDFGIPSDQLPPDQLAVREKAAVISKAQGEPFLTFIDDNELIEELRALGFTKAENLTRIVANNRYFANRPDGLQIQPGGRRLVAAYM